MKANTRTENLCDTCLIHQYPECQGNDVEFGDGYGDDNIIQCENCEQEVK